MKSDWISFGGHLDIENAAWKYHNRGDMTRVESMTSRHPWATINKKGCVEGFQNSQLVTSGGGL